MSGEVHFLLGHVQGLLHFARRITNEIFVAVFAEALLFENLKERERKVEFEPRFWRFEPKIEPKNPTQRLLTLPTKLSADPMTSNELGRPPWGLEGVEWTLRWLIPFLSITAAILRLEIFVRFVWEFLIFWKNDQKFRTMWKWRKSLFEAVLNLFFKEFESILTRF